MDTKVVLKGGTSQANLLSLSFLFVLVLYLTTYSIEIKNHLI